MEAAQGGAEDRRPFVVEKDPAGERLVVHEGNDEGELTYRRRDVRLSILHTGVPARVEGRGIGGALVHAAVDLARAEGLTVVPRCSFARHWLEAHPDVAGTVTIDWS